MPALLCDAHVKNPRRAGHLGKAAELRQSILDRGEDALRSGMSSQNIDNLGLTNMDNGKENGNYYSIGFRF